MAARERPIPGRKRLKNVLSEMRKVIIKHLREQALPDRRQNGVTLGVPDPLEEVV